ncbi:MAG: hypothetical protein WBG71_14525 [Leeuwenhoekiella sp.]
MKKQLPILLLISTLLLSCKTESNSNPETEETTIEETTPVLSEAEAEALQINEALGIENWGKVKKISFTFNVARNGELGTSRSWVWMPKKDSVVMKTKDQQVAYSRKDMDSTAQNADRGFINDSFWLLAPYHMQWDEGIELSLTKKDSAIIAQEPMQKITMTYTGDGGYTPGDAYDFYYDENYKIKEWVFRNDNAPAPSMTTTYEDYVEKGGLVISTMHKSGDGSLKLYFTDVEVEMEE